MERLTIERLGHLGDGIAPGPVFVQRALPGEVVEGEVRDGRIATPRILTPSVNRVSARCKHYKGCGGCSLLHASDTFVGDWKQGIVIRALEAVGISAQVRAVHTSSENSRRRATLTGRRTKAGAILGFHAQASGTLIDIPECRILAPQVLEALSALRRLVVAGGSRKGLVRLAVTVAEQGLDVLASGGRDPDLTLRETLAEISRQGDFARLVWNGEQIAERRRPTVSFRGHPVPFPAGAFLQATPEGEAALQACVEEALDGVAPVVDLFSGCGTFSLPLAEQSEVHAVEGDASLLKALDAGWRHGVGLRKVSIESRDLFRQPLLADELSRYRGAVIDPPRAGAEAQTKELAACDIARVAAVSCNPVTFARDAAILLGGGFTLEWIDVIDQFRWSPHIEIAALFKRA